MTSELDPMDFDDEDSLEWALIDDDDEVEDTTWEWDGAAWRQVA